MEIESVTASLSKQARLLEILYPLHRDCNTHLEVGIALLPAPPGTLESDATTSPER